MKTVGLAGGSSLCELGPAADVELFFACVHAYAVPKLLAAEGSIVTDRLYRRYLREEEMGRAGDVMSRVQQIFRATPVSSVDLSGLRAGVPVTRLDPGAGDLGVLFGKYFECFAHCKESAELFKQSWNILQPIRLVLADTADFMLEKRRPLSEYDALHGRPFWLRHIPG